MPPGGMRTGKPAIIELSSWRTTMVQYRRRSNALGWLAFFGIGAVVLAGLILAMVYFKPIAEKIYREDPAATAKAQAKATDPMGKVRQYLEKITKEQGRGYQFKGVLGPKELNSEKLGRKVFLVRARWIMTGEDTENKINDQMLIIDGNKIEVIEYEEWDRQKGEKGISEEP